MLTSFTFPGQGTQYVHMLQNLPDHPDVQKTLTQAQEGLHQGLSELDSSEALKDSRNVQLALLIKAVAWGRYLKAHGAVPDFVLGLSIGAYPAAVIADKLDFYDALRLVDLRGQLMQQAFPSGYGMLAISGAPRSVVETQVDAQQKCGHEVYLANLNAEDQFVLSGDKQLLKATAKQIREKVPCQGRLLEVSVPSHCPLLVQQASQLQQAMDKVTLHHTDCGYVSAARARVLFKTDAIKQDLAANMATQIHWHDSNQMLIERGVSSFIELPPGATLTSLVRRMLPNGDCFSVSNTNLNTLLHNY